jgi:hypothetical protein
VLEELQGSSPVLWKEQAVGMDVEQRVPLGTMEFLGMVKGF